MWIHELITSDDIDKQFIKKKKWDRNAYDYIWLRKYIEERLKGTQWETARLYQLQTAPNKFKWFVSAANIDDFKKEFSAFCKNNRCFTRLKEKDCIETVKVKYLDDGIVSIYLLPEIEEYITYYQNSFIRHYDYYRVWSNYYLESERTNESILFNKEGILDEIRPLIEYLVELTKKISNFKKSAKDELVVTKNKLLNLKKYKDYGEKVYTPEFFKENFSHYLKDIKKILKEMELLNWLKKGPGECKIIERSQEYGDNEDCYSDHIKIFVKLMDINNLMLSQYVDLTQHLDINKSEIESEPSELVSSFLDYYQDDDFLPGFMFNDQAYYNLWLKYDLINQLDNGNLSLEDIFYYGDNAPDVTVSVEEIIGAAIVSLTFLLFMFNNELHVPKKLIELSLEEIDSESYYDILKKG